ncbi:type VII secretion protein EccB [Arthrobacter sp. SLBN-53]|uniref:type VII secretion protein EccB n=1 Tax=Arthrobacter sp. SLBN-53 TaxID=2768412 RepID=UPI001153A93D|nr:type VII secretion protein EccB [Arthrobacter sp. SLBN-53]TQK30789.1 type VII secretion protein EccB [Arthrobacter sp. SLBN-53]
MARRSVSRLEVSGYRFLTRRIEYALVCRDTRMLDDPLRIQRLSLASGLAVAAIVLAVCAVLALLRPHGPLGDDPIVVVRESGAMYVRVGDTVHPTPNLASARLIAGTPAQPRMVGAAMLDDAELGPAMGIVGAPNSIGVVLDSVMTVWTLCDGAPERATTLIVGAPIVPSVAPPMLVTARGSARTYLLHDGRKRAVDLRDRSVIGAMRLEGVVPLNVSRVLLDMLPESTAARATAPAAAPVGAQFGDVLCAQWRWTGIGQSPETTTFTATAVPAGPSSVALAQADGPGPHIDAVSIPMGRSVYARAAGSAGDGSTTGPRYLITGTGAAFGVRDEESAAALGLPQAPGAAPWPVLAVLPRGPELAIDSAVLMRDVLTPP